MRILPSKRAHLYILERSRIMVRVGRVEYVADDGREARGFNIPIANTSFVLIGPGSSITNEAVYALSKEGVCVGFCGSGGTPLLSAQDPFPDLLLPASEYREPRFLQQWIEIWRCPERRLNAARQLFLRRLDCITEYWQKLDFGSHIPGPPDGKRLATLRQDAAGAADIQVLLGIEGTLARMLYAIFSRHYGFSDFTRQQGLGIRSQADPNSLLDHGNYLAYGLASVVLWALGLPASLAVCHGKTRRGGLVFDVADVIKDGLVLPLAFVFAAQAAKDSSLTETDFRSQLLDLFDDARALDRLFETLIDVADQC